MTNSEKLLLQIQDLSAKEITILLGALEGIQTLPDHYADLNSLAAEISELRKSKEVIDDIVNNFGKVQKKRKPRADKGLKKNDLSEIMDSQKEISEIMDSQKEIGKKTETKPKKEPKPKTKIKTEDKPTKETADEIKANIEEVGSEEDKDAVFNSEPENEIGL